MGFPWYVSPEGCRCIAADYADLGDGSISVFNQQIESNNMYGDGCGRACQPDPQRPGELLVTFAPTGDGKSFKPATSPTTLNEQKYCRLLSI